MMKYTNANNSTHKSNEAVAVGCTGISLTTINQDHISARTIEWGDFDLDSKLVVSSPACSHTSQLPDDSKGHSWQNKYGFVGISVSQDSFIGEGVNEKGLNAGLFYFKGYGSLAPLGLKNHSKTIIDMDVVRWLLGNFETVDEVKKHFKDIIVAPVFIDQQGNPSPTAHWRVTDTQGGSIVIEIMNEGVVTIHENPVGVITNSPDFTWHVTNLNNYIHLQPGTESKSKIGAHEIKSMSLGTSAHGLPGDYTSTSRFVRAAYLKNTAPPLSSAIDAVSQAFHILNNFDIPLGTEFSWKDRDHIPKLPSATQWTAVSDLSNKIFYFKTMHDSSIKRVQLEKLAFKPEQESVHPIDDGDFSFQDLDLS